MGGSQKKVYKFNILGYRNLYTERLLLKIPLFKPQKVGDKKDKEKERIRIGHGTSESGNKPKHHNY